MGNFSAFDQNIGDVIAAPFLWRNSVDSCVGFFWFLPSSKPHGMRQILPVIITLSDAERYGECLTHPSGHADFWRELGKSGRNAIASTTEYDDHPRGRVVFDTKSNKSVIYIDDRLKANVYIKKILTEYMINCNSYIIRLDEHYRMKALCL